NGEYTGANRQEYATAKAKFTQAAAPGELHDMIWLLGEVAFVLLRRAKLEFHGNGEFSRHNWLRSNLCCNLALDLCGDLPSWLLDFDIESMIKLHSIYSVGLANLGRFHEADRHLNEAQALLGKSRQNTTAGM